MRSPLMLMILACLLSCCAAAGELPKFIDNDVECHGYLIHVHQPKDFVYHRGGTLRFKPTRITIRSRAAGVLAKFNLFGESEEIRCEEDPLGIHEPVATIVTVTGGSYDGHYYSYWALGRNPRNLLTYEKGKTFEDDEHFIRDLDGDGVAEIVSTYDATYCMAECGAASRPTRIVFCRVGSRYRDCTRKYPQIVISNIRELESGPDGDWDAWFRTYDIYANALMIGREAEALVWLKAHTPADDYRVFLKDLPKVRASVAVRKQRIRWFATRGSMASSHSGALR